MKDPQKSIEFHENSAFHLSFSRKSVAGRGEKFRPSAEKLIEVRIPRPILFKFRCSEIPDDPYRQMAWVRYQVGHHCFSIMTRGRGLD